MVIGYGRIGVHCYQSVSWKGWSKKERRRTKNPVPEWCVALPLEYKEKVQQEGKPVGGKNIFHCLCFQECKNVSGRDLRGIFQFIVNCV